VGCDLYALLDWLVDTVGSLGYAECMTLTIPSTMHWSIDSMKQGILADLLIPFNNENLLAKVQEAVARKEIEETTKNAFTSSETRILHGVGDLC
jgi:FixJ family two-component response regulator